MKTAIPVDTKNMDTTVCDHFGRAPFFMVYNDKTDSVTFIANTAIASSGGAGIKAAQTIVDNNINVLLTPRLGENAGKVLQAAKIKIYQTNGASAKANLDAAQKNELKELAQFHSGFHGRQ